MKNSVILIIAAMVLFIAVKTGAWERAKIALITAIDNYTILDTSGRGEKSPVASVYCTGNDRKELKDTYDLVIMEENGEMKVRMGGTFRQKASQVVKRGGGVNRASVYR